MATKKKARSKKRGGCAAKRAAIGNAKTPKARGKALAAYMKAGCGKKGKKKSKTSRKRKATRRRKRR